LRTIEAVTVSQIRVAVSRRFVTIVVGYSGRQVVFGCGCEMMGCSTVMVANRLKALIQRGLQKCITRFKCCFCLVGHIWLTSWLVAANCRVTSIDSSHETFVTNPSAARARFGT
jgi:hypothetical protein